MKIFALSLAGLAFCAGLLALTGCTSTNSTDDYNFDRIELSEHGTMAVYDRYVAERTKNGVLLSYYRVYMAADDREELVYQREEGPEVYEALVAACAQAKMRSWDGYSGSNPHVLDGGGFSLDVVLSDGSTVSAHGSNAQPKRFGLFSVPFVNAVCFVNLQSNQYHASRFQATLPETWVGKVQVDVTDPCFQLAVPDSQPVCLVRFDTLEYRIDHTSDYRLVGTLVPDQPDVQASGDDQSAQALYLYARICDNSADALSGLTHEQLAVADAVERDFPSIIASVRGINGYRLAVE